MRLKRGTGDIHPKSEGIPQVSVNRLGSGQRLACVSAVLLLASMFFDWFGVKAINTSNLLFAVRAGGPGKDVWEARGVTPVVLVLTIVVVLVIAGLRFTNVVQGPTVGLDAVSGVLGAISSVLIVWNIVAPPVFVTEMTIKIEGTARWPMFLALLAAVGIAVGSCWEIREKGIADPLPDC
jgi:hypothetical protein